MEQRYIETEGTVWDEIYGIEDCRHPGKIRAFNEEVQRAGLEDLDFQLITPERPFKHPYGRRLSYSGKRGPDAYYVEITVSPNGIQDHIHPRPNLMLSPMIDTYEYNRYINMDFLSIFRDRARIELNYIKWGLRDFESHINWIVGLFRRRQEL